MFCINSHCALGALEREIVEIGLKRIYEPASPEDGYRVLVDRLWPRGVSKRRAQLDSWLKEIAPSQELRKWFRRNHSCWREFRNRYLSELTQHRAEARLLTRRSDQEHVTLIFAASDRSHNNAVVLRQYLRLLRSRQR